MGQHGSIDGYSIKGETRPDAKMGRREGLTSAMRRIMKQRAARKRRQRDRQDSDSRP